MRTITKLSAFFVFILVFLHFFSFDIYPGWFKHYGGTQKDVAYSIQQTSDGGYIVAGDTESFTHGADDFGIYKLNSSGNKVWFKHYGGTMGDSPTSIQQTSDGGYIVTGHTTSYTHGSSDFAIYKLNSIGNKVWFKHYGGSSNDIAYSIKQTSDGGYIVAGYTVSFTYGGTDFGIYKLNSSGNKTWFKHYGGSGYEDAYSIQQTSDGGYIVAGYSNSYTHGGDDFAIYKLDSSGSKVWFKHYGGASHDAAYSIQQASDGGYIVTGYTESYTYGSSDFAIYRLNSIGNKVWFKHYGGTDFEEGNSIRQTSEGGYIVAGITDSYTYGSSDFAIYKLNSSGSKAWFKHYGGAEDDGAYSVRQTSDGGYIVAGLTESYTNGLDDFAVYRLDSDGNK